ncbi:MAG TPA: nucleotide exchange factor GrpE [Clostridium sp.]|jgi:molecular chaperone GrpE|nr:nucleotide exchange factor GrpE [Clostridium sp.]
MTRDKDLHDKNQEIRNNEAAVEETVEEDTIINEESENNNSEGVDQLKVKLDEKSKQCEEYISMFQRVAAEFDNYKKRTAKEKSEIYDSALTDVVKAFLPVIDNIERAVEASSKDADSKTLKEGIDLIYKQFKEVLGKLEVTEIEGVGSSFDPNKHNAVMHVEDDSYGENVIVEELQKGYKCKDKVIRYSMVKVAN